MQISKVEKRIKKISSFIEIFKADGKLSKIEKDLLLDYVRKLYDELSSLDDVDLPSKKAKAIKVEKVSPPIVKEIVEIDTPVVTEVSVVPEMQEEKQIEIVTQPKQAEKITEPIPVIEYQNNNTLNEGQVDELFLFDEVKDMSDRLSLTKLNDINKAIGINEKIFTIKELFGGDSAVYKTTIEALNATKNMDEARKYLSSNILEKYEWTSEQKSKKAHNFLKIVRRLYV